MNFIKIVFLFLILFLVNIINADLKIVQESLTENFDVKTGETVLKSKTIEKWIGEEKLAIIDKNHKILIDLKGEKRKFVFIDKIRKEVFTNTFPLPFREILPKNLLVVKSNPFPKLKLKKLPYFEKIGNYNCKIYKITLNFLMMKIKIKIWTSDEIIKENLLFKDNKLNLLNTIPLLNVFYPNIPKDIRKNKKSFYNKLKKIRGFWVKSEIFMDMLIRRIKIINSLKKITHEVPPKYIYDIPKGLKKIKFIH